MDTRLHTGTGGTSEIASTFMHVRSGLLQRKCACGGSSGLAGECEECESMNLQRKAVTNDAESSVVPPVVHETLRSSGRPLEQSTRAFKARDFHATPADRKVNISLREIKNDCNNAIAEAD